MSELRKVEDTSSRLRYARYARAEARALASRLRVPLGERTGR